MKNHLQYDKPRKNPPRLSVQISPDLQAKLRRCLPWGMIKPVVTLVLEDLCTALDSPEREAFLAALMGRVIKIQEWMRRT